MFHQSTFYNVLTISAGYLIKCVAVCAIANSHIWSMATLSRHCFIHNIDTLLTLYNCNTLLNCSLFFRCFVIFGACCKPKEKKNRIEKLSLLIVFFSGISVCAPKKKRRQISAQGRRMLGPVCHSLTYAVEIKACVFISLTFTAIACRRRCRLSGWRCCDKSNRDNEKHDELMHGWWWIIFFGYSRTFVFGDLKIVFSLFFHEFIWWECKFKNRSLERDFPLSTINFPTAKLALPQTAQRASGFISG